MTISNRDCRIAIRVSEDVKKEAEKRAAALNMRLSDYIRNLIAYDKKNNVIEKK